MKNEVHKSLESLGLPNGDQREEERNPIVADHVSRRIGNPRCKEVEQ